MTVKPDQWTTGRLKSSPKLCLPLPDWAFSLLPHILDVPLSLKLHSRARTQCRSSERNKETFNRLAPASFFTLRPPPWLLEDVKNSSKTPGSCCIITDGRPDFYAFRGVKHRSALERWIWHLSVRE